MTLRILLPIVLLPLLVQARQSSITIDASRVLNRIPEKLYGACIEDVNHEIYGGLYDQRLYGESFEEPRTSASFAGWKVLGGQWQPAGKGVQVNAGPGYKLVFEKALAPAATIQVQISFGASQTNAGLLTHVNHERTGTDNFWGYEISLDPNRQVLVLGKHRNNWALLKETKVSFVPSEWNTLKVTTTSARLQIWLNNVAVLDYTDTNDPLPAGKTALRTYNTAASFQHILIRQGQQQLTPGFIPTPVQNVSSMWTGINTTKAGGFALDTSAAFNGRQAQVIVHDGSAGIIGVANSGLNRWGIAVRRQQQLAGSIWLKGEGLQGPVTVALQSADGSKVYASQQLNGITQQWEKYSFRLTSTATDPKARFVFYLSKGGKLRADQATLLSTGEDRFKELPLRADIAHTMQEQGLNFLRYGGTMVNAPGYRWKKMIGERDRRPPYTGHWYPWSTNGFGIEDFLQYCEAAGFEAAFAVNIEETPQDMADMVEYLKGDTTTYWGKQRAKNGHPAPYKVKYFEIGNEEVLFNGDVAAEYDHYIERFNLLHAAMRAKDTSIQFINSVWWRPNSPNSEKLFRALNGKADYWDLHTDADDPRAGIKVDSILTRMRELFLQWDPNTRMQCAIFEENGGLHNLARALGHATTLNAVRRHGAFVITSCAANALQPLGQNDNGWDQGQIFFTPSQVWGMPPFYAQQMAAHHHQPLRVAASATHVLDITATRSEDGKVLVLHVINASGTAEATSLTIEGFIGRKPAVKATTLSGELRAINTPEQPERIRSVETKQVLNGEKPLYTFPAYSYTILQFER
jgi:alpha-L-arabinofuranosidase